MNPDSQFNGNGEDGMAKGTLIASVVFSLVIAVIVSFFLYLLGKTQRDLEADFKQEFHEHQEQAAYRFTWIKNQLNQMQDICKAKDEKLEQFAAWTKQTVSKPLPVELLSKGGDCVVATEVPENLQPKEEH